MLKRHFPTPGFFFYSFIARQDIWSKEQIFEYCQIPREELFFFIPQNNNLLTYYAQEMGPPLTRFWSVVPVLQKREDLVTEKKRVLLLEDESLTESGRTLNIDVGMVTLENFILATRKPYAHRVYYGEGVYADLNFIYREKEFHHLPWTYPDYQAEKPYFLQVRQHLQKKLKKKI